MVKYETSKGKFAFVNFGINLHSNPDFKIIGYVGELSEEQWSEVVDEYYYQNNADGSIVEINKSNYQKLQNTTFLYDSCDGVIETKKVGISGYKKYDYGYNVYTATESGKSLMESLNIEGDNWLLIKYL
jgi:chorismate synthase